ncbi:MAG: helix-hairpin-helix domain-containing protein [Deltaproteobacteria bacterium]|nr:helix-hairpin-helix domain-containing protein [Deltaproteobacteria bacterium]
MTVLLLALAAIGGRLGFSELLFADPGPDLAPVGPLCAGFVDDSEAIIGIASGETSAELLASGIERLDLPEACRALQLPGDLVAGALIRLRLKSGGCEIGSIDRLPGPQRLVCGTGIDVNRDPVRDIELLPGIGPKKAGAIVESRNDEGPFDSLDDLARVKGIGEKTVERIRPWAEPPNRSEH